MWPLFRFIHSGMMCIGSMFPTCLPDASRGDAWRTLDVGRSASAEASASVSEGATSEASGAVWANLSAFSDGVEAIALCMDGEYVDFSGRAQPSLSYDSECGRNGLRAAVVVVWDAQERYGFSNITPMTFDNEFSVASMSVPEINPPEDPEDPPDTVAFTCLLKEPQRFRVEVAEDSTGNVVKTWTSPSPSAAVTYEWDGTDMYGTGVEDDTYRFVVTLIDEPGQPKTKPKRLEVSRVAEPRAVIVNTFIHEGEGGDPQLTGYRFVKAIRSACDNRSISVKVLNPGNAYWEDWGSQGRHRGVASHLKSERIRMFFFLGHGTHNVTLANPNGLTSFNIRRRPPPPGTERPVAPAWGWMQVRNTELRQLNIEPGKLRLVWVHACGSGRYKGRVVVDYLKDPNAWRNVTRHEMNDLARGFGIRRPEYRLDPSFYMGFYGFAYARVADPTYLNMAQAFFERFSEPDEYGGTRWTLGQVMTWLGTQTQYDVTSEFPGCPPEILWDHEKLWLKCSPPYYNIRVFSDTDRGTGPYYGDFKMSDLLR